MLSCDTTGCLLVYLFPVVYQPWFDAPMRPAPDARSQAIFRVKVQPKAVVSGGHQSQVALMCLVSCWNGPRLLGMVSQDFDHMRTGRLACADRAAGMHVL